MPYDLCQSKYILFVFFPILLHFSLSLRDFFLAALVLCTYASTSNACEFRWKGKVYLRYRIHRHGLVGCYHRSDDDDDYFCHSLISNMILSYRLVFWASWPPSNSKMFCYFLIFLSVSLPPHFSVFSFQFSNPWLFCRLLLYIHIFGSIRKFAVSFLAASLQIFPLARKSQAMCIACNNFDFTIFSLSKKRWPAVPFMPNKNSIINWEMQ